jgi:hypothetical protein
MLDSVSRPVGNIVRGPGDLASLVDKVLQLQSMVEGLAADNTKLRQEFHALEGATRSMRFEIDHTLGVATEHGIIYPTVRTIRQLVARNYKLEEAQLLSRSRHRSIVRPRQVAVYLISRLTKHSVSAIGRLLGYADHSSVMHGINVITEMRERDSLFAQELGDLENRIAAVKQLAPTKDTTHVDEDSEDSRI